MRLDESKKRIVRRTTRTVNPLTDDVAHFIEVRPAALFFGLLAYNRPFTYDLPPDVALTIMGYLLPAAYVSANELSAVLATYLDDKVQNLLMALDPSNPSNIADTDEGRQTAPRQASIFRALKNVSSPQKALCIAKAESENQKFRDRFFCNGKPSRFLTLLDTATADVPPSVYLHPLVAATPPCGGAGQG